MIEDPSSAGVLFRDFVQRVESGEDSNIESLCAKHPEEADELRERYRQWSGPGRQRGEPSVLETVSSAAASESGWGVFLEQLRTRGAFSSRYDDRGELARGGMGRIHTVFDRDLRRSLALKRLRPDWVGPEAPESVRTRFLEEAQITGQLDHPGVVPVHEIGLGDDEAPWFTMKLVQGEDLRAVFAKVATETEGWSVTRALNVLQRVCEAMSYAHAKGVVHCDLKPANVMVGHFGETYVMDWGLARVLGDREEANGQADDGGEGTTATGIDLESRSESSSSVAGTPQYMAPEQARGSALVGPRSDVYALGGMLYELLAGEAPYASDEESPYAVIARVAAGPPERLTERAPDTPPELVAICEKAMAREPGERFASMSDLASDLRAFLEGRVVQAYRTGTWVELRKWVGRNRALTSAMAAAVLATVAGLATVAVVQSRGKQRVERQRDRLFGVVHAMEDVFEQADPEIARHQGGRALEDVLEGASETGLEQLADDPEARAIFLRMFGKVELSLGRDERAEGLLRQAMELHAQSSDPEGLELTGMLGQTLRSQGRYVEAEELFREVLAGFEELGLEESDDALTARGNLAEALLQQGRAEEAMAEFAELLELEEQRFGPLAERTLTTSGNLAQCLGLLGRYEEAASAEEEVAERMEEALGPDHPKTLTAINALASTYTRLRRLEEARALGTSVLEARRRILPPGHPHVLKSRADLAVLAYLEGSFSEAEEQCRALLPELEEALGADHRHTTYVRNSLGKNLLQQSRWEEAEPVFEQVLSAYVAARGPDHLDSLDARLDLAWVRMQLHRFDEAEEQMRETWDRAIATLPADHPRILTVLRDFTRLFEGRQLSEVPDHEEEALAFMGEALERMTETYGEADPNTLFCIESLMIYHRTAGRPSESMGFLRTVRRHTPDDHPGSGQLDRMIEELQAEIDAEIDAATEEGGD